MAFLSQRLIHAAIPWLNTDRPPAEATAERLVLGVRHGLRPSTRPPVRIFLGSERRQFRAERVFLWSVEKHRDPSRIYEIVLMRDLMQFRRRLWLTGFTNYRFAIPSLCDYRGMAIYNDADQVYLSDPAELFDTDPGNAGFLSVSDRDTSVMLLDCARMANVWDAASARRLSRRQLEARAREAQLWGPLDAAWNARDAEYRDGASRLLHFTTMHTQPWQPYPEQFVYFENPTNPLWQELEQEASAAGFMPVTARRPSRDWPETLRVLSERADGAALMRLLAAEPPAERAAELTVRQVLEYVADSDLPWVLERLFVATDRLTLTVREPLTQEGGRFRRSMHYWRQQLQAAATRHPDTTWEFKRRGLMRRRRETGGPAPSGDILVLTHRKPGHDHQALALAREMARQSGRALREQRIPWNDVRDFLMQPLGREWSDSAAIVVASGWLPCRVARRLARRAAGRPRLVLTGRKCGPPPRSGVVVQCRHFELPVQGNRITTLLPLNAGRSEPLAESQAWQEWLDAPRRVALLAGGASRGYRFDDADARILAGSVSAWARDQGAALLVVTSRRSAGRIAALHSNLNDADLMYAWGHDDRPNPYALALQQADALVVTGDSESILADALASAAPVLIWPLTRRRGGPWRRISARLASLARQPRRNRRSSIRPQQGLSYLAARLLAAGLVLPPRNLEALHEALLERGLADMFDGAEVTIRSANHTGGRTFVEVEDVASRVLRRIGAQASPGQPLRNEAVGSPQTMPEAVHERHG